jgi:serine/threonine protein kinase
LDIKPGNVLVGTSGKVKLCDFGIARMALGNKTTATQRLVMGSVGFMSPEQYSGRKSVSVRSDIYALGATAYFALFGETPVGVSDKDDLLPCIKKAMQSNPDERFESVKDFRRAFIMESGFGAYPAPPTIMAKPPEQVPEPSSDTKQSPGAQTVATADILTTIPDGTGFHDTATINVDDQTVSLTAEPQEQSEGPVDRTNQGPEEKRRLRENATKPAPPQEAQTTGTQMTETSSGGYLAAIIGGIVIMGILGVLLYLVFK